MWGWQRLALVSPEGVAPSRMVCVSASVNLPLHHKVQKFSSGTGWPGWSQKKGRKTVVVVVVYIKYQPQVAIVQVTWPILKVNFAVRHIFWMGKARHLKFGYVLTITWRLYFLEITDNILEIVEEKPNYSWRLVGSHVTANLSSGANSSDLEWRWRSFLLFESFLSLGE